MIEIILWIKANIETFVLIVSSITISLLILYWHIDKESKFDIRDILIDTRTGRTSLFKLGQVLALFVSTWVLIYETRASRLSEWLFLGYMVAWSGSNLINKYIDKANNNRNDSRQEYETEPRYEETKARRIYEPPP